MGGGVIAFITNNGWIDSISSDGFRASLEKEFSSIYILDLKGRIRGKNGDLAKREGENIFPIMTGVCITILVKNQKKFKEKADIFYYSVQDYLKKNEKLELLKNNTMLNLELNRIVPNLSQDWVNQRTDKFFNFIPLIDKDNKNNKDTFFRISSSGIKTNRDVWAYSFSKVNLEKNMKESINFYNKEVEKIIEARNKDKNINIENIINTNPKNISWSGDLKKSVNRFKLDEFNKNDIAISIYRPFTKQYLYFNKFWNERQYQQAKFKDYLSIGTVGIGGNKEFSVTILNELGDFQTLQNANFYPLYYKDKDEKVKSKNKSLFDETLDGNDVEKKKNGISDYIFNLAKEKYFPNKISREDIFYYVYGFLHNEDYKKEFEADLKKLVPRLPLVDDYKIFKTYSDIGKELANLHLNYESIKRDKNIIVEGEETNNFKVVKMRFENKKDTIIFNSDIKIKNIPLKAYDYQVNGKSAIEWIVDRYTVTVDKNSEIENNPNLWCEENKNPRYILDLLLSIISLSLKTIELIKKLPKIEF